MLFHKPRFLLAHIIVRLRQLGLELREICLVVQQVALASTFSVCMCLKFARDTMNTSYIYNSRTTVGVSFPVLQYFNRDGVGVAFGDVVGA